MLSALGVERRASYPHHRAVNTQDPEGTGTLRQPGTGEDIAGVWTGLSPRKLALLKHRSRVCGHQTGGQAAQGRGRTEVSAHPTNRRGARGCLQVDSGPQASEAVLE